MVKTKDIDKQKRSLKHLKSRILSIFNENKQIYGNRRIQKVLGAWTLKHANRKVLKIAVPAKNRTFRDDLFCQIKSLSPPFVYANE